MTIITTVKLRAGCTEQWDRVMQARVNAAREAHGWVSAQLLNGVAEELERVIVGVWASEADWAAWHDDEAFKTTRVELAGLQERHGTSAWFQVVEAMD